MISELKKEAQNMSIDHIYAYLDTWFYGIAPSDLEKTLSYMNKSIWFKIDYFAVLPMLQESCLRKMPYQNCTQLCNSTNIDFLESDFDYINNYFLLGEFCIGVSTCILAVYQMTFCRRRHPKKKI